MKKKKSASIDLKTMWDRASKTRKIGFGSTSTSQLVTIESEAVPNVPSVQSITVESQIHIQSVPSVEDEPEIAAISVVGVVTEPEPEVASNDPNIASTTTPTATTEHEQQQPEPSTWSPIRDDDSEADYQSSEDAVYGIDLLPHDPGRRIPIKRYDVNERNSVIRGYIAMGPCRPRNHNFPSALMNGLSSTNQTLSERKAVVESYRTLAASMQALITGHLLSVSSNLISSEMFC